MLDAGLSSEVMTTTSDTRRVTVEAALNQWMLNTYTASAWRAGVSGMT